MAARVPAKSPAAVRRPTAIWSLPAWLNRRTLIWALYDVAGSAYFGVVPVVLFPVLFTTVIAPGPNASLYWGLTVSAALLTAGLLSPFVGALADRTGTRWRLLVLATLASVVATASCYFLLPGQILLAAAIYVAAQGGYLIATSLYESYLPRIAAPGEGGRVSGFGWAVGFIGGIAAILAILTFTRGPAGLESGDSYRFGFVIVAVIFGVIAAAALFGLRRMGDTGHVSTRRGAWSTLRHWREHREIFKLILASYLINDGMVTIVAFSANFFRVNFGASMDRLLLLLLAYHVIALPATFAFGALADRWSHRKAIALSLSIWIGALLLMAFGDGDWVPFSVVALLAIVFGSTQAMLRSLLAGMVPDGRAAEFFGFSTLAGRLSAALGPLLYGVITAVSGNERIALLSILILILAGGFVLAKVRLPPSLRPVRLRRDATEEA